MSHVEPRPFATDTLPPGLRPKSEIVTVFGPASLSNLGPGFDALGLCIDALGDVVDAWAVDLPGVHLVQGLGDDASPRIPDDPTLNTASVAASSVLAQHGSGSGLALRIRKGIPIGSGIGGSAASAAAGAFAACSALDGECEKERLVDAVLAGEAMVSGTRHGDNVLPALFGGLVLVSPRDPTQFRRIQLPKPLSIAVLIPDTPVMTRQAREMLPEHVLRRDATTTAAALAFLIDAFRCGDWETVGKCIMQDRLVEPVRARMVPCYDDVRDAALEAGAPGCALTGSGPAMFALAGAGAPVEAVLEAMKTACIGAGLGADGFTTSVDDQGARILEPGS